MLDPSLCHPVETSTALLYDPWASARPRDTCMALCPGGDVERRVWRWAKICIPHKSQSDRDVPYPLHQVLGPAEAAVHVEQMRRDVCVTPGGSKEG